MVRNIYSPRKIYSAMSSIPKKSSIGVIAVVLLSCAVVAGAFAILIKIVFPIKNKLSSASDELKKDKVVTDSTEDQDISKLEKEVPEKEVAAQKFVEVILKDVVSPEPVFDELGKDENTSKLEKEVAPEKFVEVILKDVVSPEPVLDKLGKLKQGCDILKSVKVKPRDAVKVGLDKDGVSSELKNKHIALLKKSYKNIKFPRDFLDTGYMPMINNVFTPVYKLIRASNTLDLGDLASKEIVFNDLVVGSNMRTSAKFTYILSSYGLFLERKSLLESFKPGTIPDLELTLASYNDQLEKADKSLNQFISSKKGLAEIGRSMEELSNKISNIPRVMYRKAAMLVMLYTIYENVLEDVLDSGRDDPSADKSYKGGDWEWSNIFSGCIKFNPSLGFMSNRSSGICGDALAEDIIDVPGSSLYVTDTLKDIETNFKKK